VQRRQSACSYPDGVKTLTIACARAGCAQVAQAHSSWRAREAGGDGWKRIPNGEAPGGPRRADNSWRAPSLRPVWRTRPGSCPRTLSGTLRAKPRWGWLRRRAGPRADRIGPSIWTLKRLCLCADRFLVTLQINSQQRDSTVTKLNRRPEDCQDSKHRSKSMQHLNQNRCTSLLSSIDKHTSLDESNEVLNRKSKPNRSCDQYRR